LSNKSNNDGYSERIEKAMSHDRPFVTDDRPSNGSNGMSPRDLTGASPFATRPGTDGPTDLQDIARRTVGQHRWAILALVLIGAAIAGFAHGGAQTYTATTRVVLDTPDPTTRSEAIAISDTVQAIATSPTLVRAAVQAAHIKNRDPLDIAEHHVSVTGLGSSAIVSLSVSDAKPGVAAALANAISQRVILTREQFASGTRDHELATLEHQTTRLSARIAAANVRIDALNSQIAQTTGAQGAALRARRDAVLRQSDFLTQQRGVLESERVSILGAAALRPRPSVVAEATPPLQPDSSGRLQYMVLGGLLGLIIGVGLAALSELIRPTVVGGDALARQFGVPVLGTLRTSRAGLIDEREVAAAAGHVRLAARAAGVHRVELVGSPGGDLTAPLATLRDATAASGLEVVMAGSGAAATDGVSDPDAGYPGQAGVVLITPYSMRRSEIVEMGYLVAFRRATLLGVITQTRPGPMSGRFSRPITPNVAHDPA
jgi:capsular polysaccharide biosynthesis protein